MTIHPSAPPNVLSVDELRVRAGLDGVSLSIDPAHAGWRYLAFRAVALANDERFDLGGAGSETAVVVISGGGITLAPDFGAELELTGRATVFDGKTWAAYLPPGRRGHLTGKPSPIGEKVVVAVAEAPASGRAGVASAPM